jgi:hypothetical protein
VNEKGFDAYGKSVSLNLISNPKDNFYLNQMLDKI